MAQALAVTLSSGQVDCKVSPNIRQQQFERVIGPIAFHPVSVIFETSNHAVLLEKVGVRDLVNGVIDELLALANANGCKFDGEFKQNTIEEMSKATGESIMWQDFNARRPMEVEIYLGSPIKLARDSKVPVPRIESLYAILHNVNIINRNKPRTSETPALHPPSSPTATSPLPPRMPSQNGHRPPPMTNGNGMPPRGPRPRGSSNLSQAGMRRGPPPVNGGPPNGYGRLPPAMNNMNMVNGGGSRQASRRGSMDESNLEEFSHLVLYDDIPEGSEPGGDQEHNLREREMHIRQREMALREQEMRMRRGPPPGAQRRAPPPRRSKPVFDDDDDDDDDYFDPMANPAPPMIDPDNFDMMSVTSKKNRKIPGPSQAEIRRNPDELNQGPPRGARFRPSFSSRNRSSQLNHAPTTTDNILDDPLLNYSSNRYGAVDRTTMNASSRANSLTTTSRLDEMPYGPGPGGPPGMNGAYPRRTSQSPGNPYSPSMRGGSRRPSPPNGYAPGPGMNGPSPPNGVRQPVSHYPPGQGNQVAPQEVEQHAGVSTLPQKKLRNVRSLTGSASASADSGELDSDPSAHSSQGSLQQNPPIGVR